MTTRKITHTQLNDLMTGFRNIYVSDSAMAKQYRGKVRHLRSGKAVVEGEKREVQAIANDSLGNVITIGMDGIWRQHDAA